MEQNGEIVFTRSSKVVLDIGLWHGGMVYARSDKFSGSVPPIYGNTDSHWFNTGIYMTLDEWKTISYEKYTKEICDILKIKYKFKNKTSKKCLKCVYNTGKYATKFHICGNCKHNYSSNFKKNK